MVFPNMPRSPPRGQKRITFKRYRKSQQHREISGKDICVTEIVRIEPRMRVAVTGGLAIGRFGDELDLDLERAGPDSLAES